MGTNDSDLYTGSCGFVAAEMILGYYDSYYNDNIIGESFDVTTSYDFDNYSSINIMSYDNSPGIDDVFHQYLINYAYSNNLITNNFILTISNVETLLELYLTYKNISYNMHTHNSAFNVVTFCENYIDNEYPVVALILMGLEGHFVVAYGYDEDSIIANFGWKGTNVATNIRNYFISGAFCLEINDSHICSNNYEWTSCGCTGIVCPCCTITCNHGNYSYSTYSNFYHKKTCVLCGNIGYEAHILTYNGNYYVCANCGYIENHIHSYSYLPRGDGKRHIASCTCGESKLEMCIGYIQLGGSSVCMYCGQTIR